ncbi:MAG: EamA family transporter [Desulfobacterales bacterium]|nr:EamA family transporter [Desulfobacterales bacterium]
MDSSPTVSSVRWGYLFATLAAVLWGVSGSAAKYLFINGVTPFHLVQLRLTIAAAGLLLYLLLRNPALLKVARRDIPYFAVFGCIGMAGVQFTYLFAISKIHVAAAILLQYLAPAFIALHAVIFFRDRLNYIILVALGGAFAGCYLVVGAYNLDLLAMNLLGIVSGLLSAVGFAWYSIQGEYGMRRYSPWTVLFYAMFFGALTWNVCLPPLDGFLPPRSVVVWGWILYIGVLGTLVPFGLFLEGVNLIRSTRASITATLEPIMAGVLSFVFLHETMGVGQLLGAGLVILSVIVLQVNQDQDAKAPARLRALADRS